MIRNSSQLAIRAAPRTGLAVTPQMKLALELLALPAVELRRRLEAEALANPALELESEETAAHGSEAAGAAPGGDRASGDDAAGFGPADGRPEQGWRGRGGEPGAFRGLDRLEVPGPPSLAEHLRAQLVESRLTPRERRAVEYLIGCLDDRGRLLVSTQEAAADLGGSPEEVEAATAALRGLDPPGIGARDLRECLLLQLRAAGRAGTPAWRLVDETFDLLASRRLREAARRLGIPGSQLADGLREIRRLVPHPGRLFAVEPVRYIVPDLTVRRLGAELVVALEERSQPRPRIGRLWSDLAAGPAGADPEVREFAARRHLAARRLMRAVDRRRETLVRVMECIVLEQQAFFERGTAALRPMRLKTLAGRLGLHESTVARVVRGKYVDTPLGIFPLRHFFSGGFDRSGRPGTSARAVRERIRASVEAEAPDRPLTDEELAARLGAEGIAVARRTVAKYRNSLGIEQARLRRLRRRRELRGDGAGAAPGRRHPLDGR